MHPASTNEEISKNFKETKYMSFLIKDNQLLKKINKIWDKISKGEKYLKKILGN